MNTKDITRAVTIDRNVASLIVSLRVMEKNFAAEYGRLERQNTNECYEAISDQFYQGYVQIEAAFKRILAETTMIGIDKLI